MGTHNNTVAEVTCPRCNTTNACDIDLFFGDTSRMVTVRLGSLYPFLIGRAPQNGGPPTTEEYFGVSYTECPSCKRDFHCLAKVQNGLLVSVAADHAKLPYIHDREQIGTMSCPQCHELNTSARFFDGFVIGQLVCLSKECAQVTIFPIASSQLTI